MSTYIVSHLQTSGTPIGKDREARDGQSASLCVVGYISLGLVEGWRGWDERGPLVKWLGFGRFWFVVCSAFDWGWEAWVVVWFGIGSGLAWFKAGGVRGRVPRLPGETARRDVERAFLEAKCVYTGGETKTNIHKE